MYRDVLKIFLLYRLPRSVVKIGCSYVIEYYTILGDFAYISYLFIYGNISILGRKYIGIVKSELMTRTPFFYVFRLKSCMFSNRTRSSYWRTTYWEDDLYCFEFLELRGHKRSYQSYRKSLTFYTSVKKCISLVLNTTSFSKAKKLLIE